MPTEEQFIQLLEIAKDKLEKQAQNDSAFVNISPDGFEKAVCDALNAAASGTVFENKVSLIAGHRFPDIIVGDSFGVEVKTCKSNHWQTLGNSVLESTRIDQVKSIFIFFGKIGNPSEFRFRKYEECLSEVQITHSPRYLIDMELPSGDSIFDKMGMPYDVVRNQDRPIRQFIEYYKKVLGNDTSVWWLNNDTQETSAPIKITFWADLDIEKKKKLVGYALFLFPELFGQSATKYNRFSAWLIKNHSIISPSMRDSFSAGGKVTIRHQGNTFSVPRVVETLISNKTYFCEALSNASVDDIMEYLVKYGEFHNSIQGRFDAWRDAFLVAVSGKDEYSPAVCQYIFSRLSPA